MTDEDEIPESPTLDALKEAATSMGHHRRQCLAQARLTSSRARRDQLEQWAEAFSIAECCIHKEILMVGTAFHEKAFRERP